MKQRKNEKHICTIDVAEKIYFAYTKSKYPGFFVQSAERSPDGKRKQRSKSSVLVDLMYEDESAEENERSFYNALHEEQLPNNIEIKKLRVENVVYMNFKNDFHLKQEIRF